MGYFQRIMAYFRGQEPIVLSYLAFQAKTCQKGLLHSLQQCSIEVYAEMGFVSASPTLRLKIAQKPCIFWSLGPKAIKYESLEP